MRSLVPPPLRPGDRIGVAAPAGPIRQESDLESGLAHLEARGYAPVRGLSLKRRDGYLAGTDVERLEDLNRLIADPTIAAIWVARGGYGSARIIEGVDLAPLKKRPKFLIGYSDATVLHAAAFRRLRLSTLYGPNVVELGNGEAFDETSLWRSLAAADAGSVHDLPAPTIVRPGLGEGMLIGGCLSLLVSLIGTPWEVPTDGAILFWEEVGEEPYRIDRMLGHLRLAGRLEKLRGMVVGRLVGCQAREPGNDVALAEILETHLKGTGFPVVVDFPAGHCPGKVTLPLGRPARLDTSARRLTISGR